MAALPFIYDSPRRNMQMQSTLTQLSLVVILMAGFLTACSEQPVSAEQQIRTLIGQAETAAENKNLDDLKNLIADDYRDSQGHDKKTVSRLLAFYFLRHQSIYLLTRIHSITVAGTDQTGKQTGKLTGKQSGTYASISLSVAMAGTPFPENLSNFRADFFNFDIVMMQTDEEDWQVWQADWRRSDLQDFL
jgi:hypothetical protein